MNILNDEDAKEIHRVLCATVGADYLTIAKAASDFTIKKLAAGVSVDPAAWIYPSDLEKFQEGETFGHAYSIKVGCPDEVSEPLYTATAIAAARVQENERCAKVCDVTPGQPFRPSIEAAWAIRALLGKEQP